MNQLFLGWLLWKFVQIFMKSTPTKCTLAPKITLIELVFSRTNCRNLKPSLTFQGLPFLLQKKTRSATEAPWTAMKNDAVKRPAKWCHHLSGPRLCYLKSSFLMICANRPPLAPTRAVSALFFHQKFNLINEIKQDSKRQPESEELLTREKRLLLVPSVNWISTFSLLHVFLCLPPPPRPPIGIDLSESEGEWE